MKQIKLILNESNSNLQQTIVSCIFYTYDGEYLLQLRDNKIGLPLRNHWALFGGEVDEGENEFQAIKREMFEELRFDSSNYQWFHEAIYVFPAHHKRIVRKIYYTMLITTTQVLNMKLCEGAEKKLFKLNQVLILKKISPWDLSAILLHARQNTIFP
jgi:8-oxo-dGTP pyrophosphatase MutT (NUDIX family)